MISFFVFALTAILVIVCALLILLVLVQLPKKDAGAGLAFGAGTADALFGAGSGNTLTKATKYSAVVFLLLCLVLSWLQTGSMKQSSAADFTSAVETKQKSLEATAAQAKPTAPSTAPANGLLSATMSAPGSNAVVTPPATNSAK